MSLYVSDQALAEASLRTWYRNAPLPSTAEGAAMTATPRAGTVNGMLASVAPPRMKSMEPEAAPTLET